jgi:hypothetical protein
MVVNVCLTFLSFLCQVKKIFARDCVMRVRVEKNYPEPSQSFIPNHPDSSCQHLSLNLRTSARVIDKLFHSTQPPEQVIATVREPLILFHSSHSHFLIMSDAPLFVSNPEQWIAELNATNETAIVAIVIFRGSWCEYDAHYLEKLADEGLPEDTYLVAWTSEGQAGADKAKATWDLSKYKEVIGDETCALAQYLSDEEILPDLIITPKADLNLTEGYPNGVVQPGFVMFAHHGNMVCHWVQEVVTAENAMGGANRPNPEGTFYSCSSVSHHHCTVLTEE